MVLVTNKMQGSCPLLPLSALSWREGMMLKRHAFKLQVIRKVQRGVSSSKETLSIGACRVCGVKPKGFEISAFKGSAQHAGSDDRADRSNVLKNVIELSNSRKENENIIFESSKAQNRPLGSICEHDDTPISSAAFYKLFRKWLSNISLESESKGVDKVLDAQELSMTETQIKIQTRGRILKAGWSWFWGLDSAIKVPLLFFVPLYLAVRVAYGAEVSKELTPLWSLGPLIFALYINLFRIMYALFISCSKRAVELAGSLPTRLLIIQRYIMHGQLKEDMKARILAPILFVKSFNYKQWVVEKYIDLLESIWPYYCRTVRFLKRANFI